MQIRVQGLPEGFIWHCKIL